MVVRGLAGEGARGIWCPERDDLGLGAGEGGDKHLAGAGLAEGGGAGAGGGTGGVDVIDEEHIAAGDADRIRNREGIAQVGAALPGVEAELARGGADAGEETVVRLEAEAGGGAAEMPQGLSGEQLGLVEAALACLAAEERNGGDEGVGGGIEEWGEIGDGEGEQTAERLGRGSEAVELEEAEEIAHLAGVEGEGDGAGEGRGTAAARRAELGGGAAAGCEALAFKAEGFAAGCAERTGMSLGLGPESGEAGLADGKGADAEEGGCAKATIAGEEGGDEVVENAAREVPNSLEEACRVWWAQVVLRRALGRAL